MAGNIKLSTEMLKQFCGEGGVTAQFSKIKLEERLLDITDIACIIPLDGGALALYHVMTKEEQRNADMTNLGLREALTESSFLEYAKLSRVG